MQFSVSPYWLTMVAYPRGGGCNPDLMRMIEGFLGVKIGIFARELWVMQCNFNLVHTLGERQCIVKDELLL